MGRREQNHEMFQTINEIIMKEEKPSIKLNELSLSEAFCNSDFHCLNQMRQTEQSKQHHPEGNVWIHTLMVVDEAAKVQSQSKNSKAFMWAALLHDIGKPEVTRLRKGKITAYDHDKAGARAAKELLEKVCEDSAFIKEVCALVRWHMQILFVANNMAFADIDTMKLEVDLDEVALLGMCDRLGRGGANREEVMKDIEKFSSLGR